MKILPMTSEFLNSDSVIHKAFPKKSDFKISNSLHQKEYLCIV